MHRNQPLVDQNVNECKFTHKLIEKPCSETCYSFSNPNESPDTSLSETRSKRSIETNQDAPRSLNNSLNESKRSKNIDSSPATTPKKTQLDNGWSFSEETLYRVLKNIYDYIYTDLLGYNLKSEHNEDYEKAKAQYNTFIYESI